MKAASFDYVRPTGLEQALATVALDGTMALAGGQSLVPSMVRRQLRPARVCDLNALPEIAGVEVTDAEIVVGSMTRQRDLELHPVVARVQPVVARAIALIGFVGTRHRGTVGGSLCFADPCGELPALAALLDARLVVRGAEDQRQLTAADFFATDFATVLRPGELLTEVRFPRQPASRYAAVKLRVGQDRPLGCLVSYASDERGVIRDPRVSIFGTSDPGRRVAAAERALAGQLPGAELFADAAAAATDLEPLGGAAMSAAYRRRLGRTAIRRALVASMGVDDD